MFKVRLTNVQSFENIMKDQLTLNNGLLMLLGVTLVLIDFFVCCWLAHVSSFLSVALLLLIE